MYLKLKKDNNRINELNQDEKSVFYFQATQLFSEDETFIGDFKKINLFVGSNNSGKSRFLRGLLKYESVDLQYLENQISIENQILKIPFENFNKNQNCFNYLESIKSYYTNINVFYQLFTNKTLSYFDLTENHHKYVDTFRDNLLIKNEIELNINNIISTNYKYKELYKSLLEFNNEVEKLQKFVEYAMNNKTSNKIYIPILRSLKKSVNLNLESFEKTTKELYKIENVEVFTGLNFYDKVKEKRNALKDERIGFDKFEKFLSENFFNKKDVEIIANLKNNHLNIYIDGEERETHNIGDGIQMLILLLFPIYTATKNSWIFIEEPETHLHPGLQRIFIETLLNDEYLKTKNLRYFFTTHSNHFLDLTIDSNEISIFQFQKENQEKFTIKNVKPNKEILDLLGVNNSSVFLANTSIWVEGPTDRKYLSKFLKLYCESKELPYLKEDIDFAFFEYGGNLIAHYLFDEDFEKNIEQEVREKINSFALSNKIYLLADNDNATGAKLIRRKELEKLSKNKNFKYQNTECKEIENLLPAKVLQDFIPELIKGTEKNKIKISFKREEYMTIGLGKFIVSQFNNASVLNFNEFIDKSGTFTSNYKNKLCDFVLNGNYTYLDLIENNDILDKIIEGLYSFIKIKSIK